MKRILHYVSYLSYLFMAIAYYYLFLMVKNIGSSEDTISYINQGLIFLGISISFIGLKDTSRPLNPASMKVWSNKKRGKIAIVLISLFIVAMLSVSGTLYYLSTDPVSKKLSSGLLIISLGSFGLLKNAVELHEHHGQ